MARVVLGFFGALKGIRLGVIRESMVYPVGSKTEQPIVDAAAKEIKNVLSGHLGATLVESGDPLWSADPDLAAQRRGTRLHGGITTPGRLCLDLGAGDGSSPGAMQKCSS